MSPEKLAYMANQIAKFFENQPHEQAINGVADHISSFWEPRMRRQFFAMLESDARQFNPLVVEAAKKVRPVAQI